MICYAREVRDSDPVQTNMINSRMTDLTGARVSFDHPSETLLGRSMIGWVGQWQRLGTAIARYHAFKACASRVSISALWRRHGRYASASSTSVTMHHSASRALVAEWYIVTYPRSMLCRFRQWARRSTAMPKDHEAVAGWSWQLWRTPATAPRFAFT